MFTANRAVEYDLGSAYWMERCETRSIAKACEKQATEKFSETKTKGIKIQLKSSTP